MYQGSIAKLVNYQTGESGWYQKLRCEERVNFVNLKDASIKLALSVVCENSQKRDNHTHYIDLTIDGEDVVTYSNFNIDAMSLIKIGKHKQTKSIQEAIKKLESERQTNTYYLNRYEEYKKRDDSIAQRIEKLKGELSKVDNGEPVNYRYCYGKHTADTKEYCWLLPDNLSVVAGDTVVVETSMGHSKAVVTRIEESAEYRNHKTVIRMG